jgi:hypothetical protein
MGRYDAPRAGADLLERLAATGKPVTEVARRFPGAPASARA